MANIFKTTLKKDVIANIASKNVNEIRFPITKFWATRLTDEYNLDDKTFVFRVFDSLEVSSPSNKDTEGETYVLNFVKTYVDGEEFVIEFKTNDEEDKENCSNDEITVSADTPITNLEDNVQEEPEMDVTSNDNDDGESDVYNDEIEKEEINISNDDIFDLVRIWFEDEKVLDSMYSEDTVFATNARQVIILPNAKVLGFKKTLPINNAVEIRIEFDMSKKIYFDSNLDFDIFEEEILKTISDIKKNNFVFIWKRYAGIFKDNDDRVYFGMKYSTRKSINPKHRYNVQ